MSEEELHIQHCRWCGDFLLRALKRVVELGVLYLEPNDLGVVQLSKIENEWSRTKQSLLLSYNKPHRPLAQR